MLYKKKKNVRLTTGLGEGMLSATALAFSDFYAYNPLSLSVLPPPASINLCPSHFAKPGTRPGTCLSGA